MRDLVKGLHERGYDVGILTFYGEPPESETSVPIFSMRRKGRGDVAFFGRFFKAIRSFRPDIVHTHTHNGKFWGRLAAITAGVPAVVHTEHNSEFGAHPLASVVNVLLLHPRTSRVIAFTRAQAEALQRAEHIDPSRLVLIPNGIPVSENSASPHLRDIAGVHFNGPLVAHVGRLSAVKNQELALRAFAAVVPSYPDATLVFIGGGPDRPQLETLTSELKLQDRVRFTGFRADARLLLADADVVLLTSRNEAMPITILEALLAGVPVVTTPWNGAADILNGGALGVVSDAMTPESVARALLQSMSDPAKVERTERAREFALSNYTLDRCVERHIELYDSVMPATRLSRA